MFPSRKFMIGEAVRSLVKQMHVRSVSSEVPAVIRVGETLPHGELYEDFPTNVIQMPDFARGKNIVMFGVSGAFSPGCSKTHLKGYLKAATTMKNNGVDEIICVSVNDAYVMGAWAAQHNTKSKIRMFADPTGCFIYSLGLGMNLTQLGGFRAMRFSMVIINAIVREIHVEPDGIGLCCALADALNYKIHLRSKSEFS